MVPEPLLDGFGALKHATEWEGGVAAPYPSPVPEPGIHAGDLDGDGRSVFMRLRDPNGAWKRDPDEPRLLVAREPDETGGEYWRVLPEGTIVGYDGATIADAPALEELDFGQNFPGDRGTGPQSRGAGAYPASEPEIAARPNIVAHVTCHTFGGLVLTPPVNKSERLPSFDRRSYASLAAKAAELTGYRAMSYLDLSQQALDRQAVGGIAAELALPPGARLAEGETRRSLGQLKGRSDQRSTATWWGYTPGTPERALVDWIVKAPAGARLSVTASHDRAGTTRSELVLARPSS